MSPRFNRRYFLAASSAALASSVFLKACASNTPTTTESAAPQASASPATPVAGGFKAAIVLPGIITDKAWNQAGYSGLEEAKKKIAGIETAYVEKVGQADQAENLSEFARRGFNVVFAHGGQFDAAIKQVAAQFPKTFFVGVNGSVSGPNMASLLIDSLQGSYLCGIIAATLTKSKKLAYIAGQEFAATQQELRGLELGAKSVDPAITIRSTFTGDWNDAAKAKEAVEALMASGADVIYQWLDNASPTVLQAAAEKGVYTFGNTTDQLDVAPKSVLTSSVKRIDLAIAKLADLAAKNQLKGEVYNMGLEEPEILYLGKFNPAVSADLQAKVKKTEDAILAKKITFESCSEGGKETRCVKGAA